tara:strand:+ start:5973 stop:6986 length:1014 start_codon:yes stop_codon:yes gene_type:complete
MILFDKENPLDDIAEIIRTANPGVADHITGNDIVVDKIENVNPADNEGFNTKALVRTVGNLNDTVGVMPVRFNRIDLSKYIPWNQMRVEVPTERGRCMPMNLEHVISKGLGTKLEATGRYRDYYIYASGFNLAKGQVTDVRMTPQPESLRYMPIGVSWHMFGLGISLEHAVTNPGVKPFVEETGGIKFTGPGEPAYDDNARTPDNDKRSHACTLGMCDFTSVWGEEPKDVIEEHGEEGKRRYKFSTVAFGKINDILRAQGLPELPDPYFDAYAVQNNYPGYPVYNHSATPQLTNRSLVIHRDKCDWDYFNLANFHDDYNSSYWGLNSDWTCFNYQLK